MGWGFLFTSPWESSEPPFSVVLGEVEYKISVPDGNRYETGETCTERSRGIPLWLASGTVGFKKFFIKKLIPIDLSLIKTIFYCLFLSIGVNTAVAQDTIIKTGDNWQFYDEAEAPEEEWQTQTEVTDEWKKGSSPLGYGNDSVVTVISFGGNPNNKHITKYFKKTFRIGDPHEHLAYKLKILRDDGIVVYLNGYEIMRDNMPSGKITNDTRANSLVLSKRAESIPITKFLFPDDFNSGTNTLSASVHQGRETSSDCLFDLELVVANDTKMIPLLLRDRSVKNLNMEIRIKELNHKQELEKRDLQLGFLEKSKNNFRIAIYVLGLLFLTSLSLLGYLFWFYRKRRYQLSKNIIDLKEALVGKDRRLMSSSLSTIHNQQFLKELKDALKDSVSDSEVVLKKEIKRTIRKIDYNLDNDEDWLNLLSHFNSVHVGFLEKLVELHPTLTETEQRHCIFIKLHMQTKEIAQMLHIDPRSVQASRYRLKKKMELEEYIDLRDYILKL